MNNFHISPFFVFIFISFSFFNLNTEHFHDASHLAESVENAGNVKIPVKTNEHE